MSWKDLSTAFKIIISVLFIIALIAVASAVYNWYSDRFKPPVSQSQYVATPAIKKAQKIDHKKILVTTRIDVLDKKEAVEKLKINDPVKSDDNKQITATADISPYDGKTSVISILDTKSGVSEIISKQEPLSTFGFPNKWEVYADLSYNTNKETGIAGGISWECLRVLKIKAELYAEARADFTNIQTGDRSNVMGLVGIKLSKEILKKE